MNETWQKILEYLLGHPYEAGYNGFEIALLGLGFICWFLAYRHIIINGFKYKFNEMPMILAAGNLAWEFCWSFIYFGNLGHLFLWGCRIWFLLDLVINYQVQRYSRLHEKNPWVKKRYAWVYVFWFITWFSLCYFMVQQGDDTKLGVVSALMINVAMSGMYIRQVFQFPEKVGQGISKRVAWLKMAGTGLITLSSVFIWTDNALLISMGTASFVLDITYIFILRTAAYKAALTAD